MRERRNSGSGGDGGGSARGDASGTPGKRTLTSAIQLQADPGSSPEPAARGSSGGGASAGMPTAVQAKMENAFDFSFSQVRVHEGPQAQALGASAYTTRDRARRSPRHSRSRRTRLW
jgi:hypothetical protein